MRLTPAAEQPIFTDDLSRSSLKAAIKQNLLYLKKLPPERTFIYGEKTYSAAWLAESLETFLNLLRNAPNDAALNQQIMEQFEVYQVRHHGFLNLFTKKMLITGYYEPFLDGSLTRKAPYLYPVYQTPPDLTSVSDAGKKKFGRWENGQLIPYWSRADIEDKNLLAGQELAYLADPVDAFILHVQGSGKIRLRDGSVRGIHYAGRNGREYRSIGKLLVDEGRLSLAEADLPGIRQYMAAHPEEIKRILHHNESFIFFKWGDPDKLVGSLGVPLTPGRSVAADRDIFPPAALAFLQSEKPMLHQRDQVRGWLPMARFVLIQDTGSAIKGTGRLDLFWGASDYARTTAGIMKHPGELFFLVKKTKDDTQETQR